MIDVLTLLLVLLGLESEPEASDLQIGPEIVFGG